MLKVGYAYEFHGCHQCVGSICMVELIACLRERAARRIFLRCLLSLRRLFLEAVSLNFAAMWRLLFGRGVRKSHLRSAVSPLRCIFLLLSKKTLTNRFTYS
jgi:hypothetical protein